MLYFALKLFYRLLYRIDSYPHTFDPRVNLQVNVCICRLGSLVYDRANVLTLPPSPFWKSFHHKKEHMILHTFSSMFLLGQICQFAKIFVSTYAIFVCILPTVVLLAIQMYTFTKLFPNQIFGYSHLLTWLPLKHFIETHKKKHEWTKSNLNMIVLL